jgi:sodium transport system ATP-binding protein
MIEVTGLRRSFRAVVAVAGVSFAARDGAITGLLGPNGAGKTTTLRLIAGMLRPDAGGARVDGYDAVADGNEVRRRLGVLSDARGLYPRLTARENVRYFGRLQGLAEPALARSIDELVELLDMGAFADRRVEGFSSGQRLKVALARALVHRPRHLLLDEPTTGLDVMSTRALRALLRRLRGEGRCIVFSSHVMQEVGALCDELVVMARGRVAAAGPPAAIQRATGKATLEDAFVAAIGTDEGVMA